jgi:SHAQKYF class myb-like DNA-binding protein
MFLVAHKQNTSKTKEKSVKKTEKTEKKSKDKSLKKTNIYTDKNLLKNSPKNNTNNEKNQITKKEKEKNKLKDNNLEAEKEKLDQNNLKNHEKNNANVNLNLPEENNKNKLIKLKLSVIRDPQKTESNINTNSKINNNTKINVNNNPNSNPNTNPIPYPNQINQINFSTNKPLNANLTNTIFESSQASFKEPNNSTNNIKIPFSSNSSKNLLKSSKNIFTTLPFITYNTNDFNSNKEKEKDKYKDKDKNKNHKKSNINNNEDEEDIHFTGTIDNNSNSKNKKNENLIELNTNLKNDKNFFSNKEKDKEKEKEGNFVNLNINNRKNLENNTNNNNNNPTFKDHKNINININNIKTLNSLNPLLNNDTFLTNNGKKIQFSSPRSINNNGNFNNNMNNINQNFFNNTNNINININNNYLNNNLNFNSNSNNIININNIYGGLSNNYNLFENNNTNNISLNDNFFCNNHNNLNNNTFSGFNHQLFQSLASIDFKDNDKKKLKKNLKDNRIKHKRLSKEGSYNCGRWQPEEHERFIEAIMKFGNEWKQVQKYVGTRSSTQARSHAQKFFVKIKRANVLDFNIDLSKNSIKNLHEMANNLNTDDYLNAIKALNCVAFERKIITSKKKNKKEDQIMNESNLNMSDTESKLNLM